MKHPIAISMWFLIAAGAIWIRAWAGDANFSGNQSQEEVVVLRNGEVLFGQVRRENEHYRIVREGSEIRLAAREVEMVCRSLDDAYQQMSGRNSATIDDHVMLAKWCLRHKMLGYAAKEIMAAMQKDPRDPRIAQLDAQLTRLREQATESVTEKATPKKVIPPASPEELERLVRTLPAGTVENFTGTIQPLLLNNCANSGCHTPGTTSSFTLLTPPSDAVAPRRLTQRNLYNTLQWVDYANPEQSKLLIAARQSHGTSRVAVFGVESEQYADILTWIAATGRGFRSDPPTVASEAQPPVRSAAAFTPASPRLTFPKPDETANESGADQSNSQNEKAPTQLPQIGTPVEPVIPSVYAPKGSVPPQLESSSQPMWKQFLDEQQASGRKKPAAAPPASAPGS